MAQIIELVNRSGLDYLDGLFLDLLFRELQLPPSLFADNRLTNLVREFLTTDWG